MSEPLAADSPDIPRVPEYMVYYIAAATVKGLSAEHVGIMCANLNVDPAALKAHLLDQCNRLRIDLDSV